jgi:hypothetical protein
MKIKRRRCCCFCSCGRRCGSCEGRLGSCRCRFGSCRRRFGSCRRRFGSCDTSCDSSCDSFRLRANIPLTRITWRCTQDSTIYRVELYILTVICIKYRASSFRSVVSVRFAGLKSKSHKLS